MRKLKEFQLLHEEVVRDSNGDVDDWNYTIIATSKTKEGLIKHARMKKLNPEEHTIEAIYEEFEDGLPMRDEEFIGRLSELMGR